MNTTLPGYTLGNISAMFNSTNETSYETPPDTSKNYTWVVAQIITLFLLISTAHVLHSLYQYGKQNRKWTWRSLKKGKLNQVVLAFTACSAMLLNLLVTQVMVVYTVNHATLEILDVACYYIKILKNTFTIFVFLNTNFFLWSRLNSLYRRPLIRKLINTPFRITSWLALTAFLVATCCFAFLLSTSDWVGSETRTCKSKKHLVSRTVLKMVANWFLGLRVSASVLMVGLLTYPLIIYRKKNQSSIRRATVNAVTLQNTGSLIHHKIRLALISVAVCVISDIGIQMINKRALPDDPLRVFESAIWDINDYINVRALIFCYFNYQEVCLNRLCGGKERRDEQLGNMMTSTSI